MARLVLPDTDAFGVVAVRAIGAGPGGAYPLVAALVPALLLLETFLERLHELFPPAERFDQLLLFVGEKFLGELLQPFFRDQERERVDFDDALEIRGEHAVEAVEVLLVL